MKNIILLLTLLVFVGCASTSSVMVNHSSAEKPTIAIMPLEGDYGEQASDLITEQLALNGIPTIERAQLNALLRENGLNGNEMFNQASLPEFGRLLGVKRMFTGTITTETKKGVKTKKGVMSLCLQSLTFLRLEYRLD